MMEQPDVRYCMAEDGVRLAYYVMGEGPPLVRASSIPSHLTAGWAMPGSADGTRMLAREHQVVTYDARGMGLSQRVLGYSLDMRVGDLRAVARHLKLNRFALLGGMHASMTAMAYAARYPDEVLHLVLVTPYADGARLYETSRMFSAYAALESVTLEQWDFVAMTLAQRATGYNDPEAARTGARFLQASITAEGLVAWRHEHRRTRVIDELGAIVAPTLVIGRENNDAIPIELVQEVAARIPNARFQLAAEVVPPAVEEDTTEMILDFLRPPGAAKPARVAPSAPAAAQPASAGTAVILFTDIVSSTALTERMGDVAFRDASRALDAGLRAAIRDAGGAVVEGKVLGDGVLATFSSAVQAIDAARRCVDLSAASELGLHIGLHAGDVIREDNNVYGGAVNIASRICALCAPGDVLVSDVVRGMARTSAGVEFDDRGEQEMKGVSESVRVYAVCWRA
jgi:class 3 adenylate cyclase/pimeloyl-ACP methyl ester carboxylesterase